MTDHETPSGADRRSRLFSRRTAVLGGATATAGAAVAVGGELVRRDLAGRSSSTAATPASASTPLAEAVVGFRGRRQAGVATPPPAHASFVGLDFSTGSTADDLRRLLRVLTDDAAALTRGTAPITDQEPQMAAIPASLTVTVGFGPKVFDLVQAAGRPDRKPSWLAPLPAFPQIDRLERRWGQADLLVQLCCDDRLTLAHAQRMLLKDLRSFGTVAWIQEGFRNAAGSVEQGRTQRNLFGQLDGTVNPREDDGTIEQMVYGTAAGLSPWIADGTSLVLRRIRMDLDTWDEVDGPGRDAAIGRRLSDGSPLTGEKETDPVDLSAKDELGFAVVPNTAHVRRATARTATEKILRRPYNYDLPTADGTTDAGLLFASYQADPVRQFVPIQRRLAQLDMLNTWTTPIGSAVFAIPPGCAEDGWIGDFLFSGR